MTTQEFSEQFDVLLDSYKLPNVYGRNENIYTIKLDEYEKSVYLTQAQNQLVIDLYAGRTPIGASYEQTEELRRYLANLNSSKILTQHNTDYIGLSPYSKFYNIDEKVLYITQEQCKVQSPDNCINNTWVDVVPIRRDEYNLVKNNPFKNKKIWRVDVSNKVIELISPYSIKEYKVSYLREPQPIILEDLEYITINGVSTQSECELHPSLHFFILETAVRNAYNYMATNIQTKDKE